MIDGDTLRLGPDVIRLYGIDAPETGQHCRNASGAGWNCGAAATARLEQLISGRVITCEALDLDRYGRVIARCEAGGQDLAAAMVASGHAWAFRSYSEAYIGEERRARAAGRGIWGAGNQPAWEFRAERRDEYLARVGETTPPGGCAIKGNISKSGERIYHMPRSPAWEKTVIREEDGERWFCDEAEARAAGWRHARGP